MRLIKLNLKNKMVNLEKLLTTEDGTSKDVIEAWRMEEQYYEEKGRKWIPLDIKTWLDYMTNSYTGMEYYDGQWISIRIKSKGIKMGEESPKRDLSWEGFKYIKSFRVLHEDYNSFINVDHYYKYLGGTNFLDILEIEFEGKYSYAEIPYLEGLKLLLSENERDVVEEGWRD